MPVALLPTITSGLALAFSVALFDQWRERRNGFQLTWAIGMLFYGIGAGAEALAAAGGWSDPLYRAWYLAGAVLTPAWLGLGTALLLGKTRFGYTYAVLLLLSGLVALMIRNSPNYAGAGPLPILYLIGAVILAFAIGVETYFQNDGWTRFAAAAIVASTILGFVLMAITVLPAPGYALDPVTSQPKGDLMPGYLRLLTPILNITGAFALVLGALFSTYVFMPKRRILPYSLDPGQSGDQFLFNFLIAIVAIPVNFVASLPGAIRALIGGRIHSRVPATLLIALGSFIPLITDSLNRAGSTQLFQVGKFLGVIFLFAGFLVSIETFREIRIPFTAIVFRTGRRERVGLTAGSGVAAGTGAAAMTATAMTATAAEPASAASAKDHATG